MDIATAQTATSAFQFGFSSGVAFAMIVYGIYQIARRRFDP